MTALDRAQKNQLGSRQARHHRQPDRHHDRHGEAARRVRQQGRGAVPQPVRQCPAAGRHGEGRHRRAGRRDPARPARHLRLSREGRRHGRRSASSRPARPTARRSPITKGLEVGDAGRDRRRRPPARRRQDPPARAGRARHAGPPVAAAPPDGSAPRPPAASRQPAARSGDGGGERQRAAASGAAAQPAARRPTSSPGRDMNPSRIFIERPVGDLAADGRDHAGRHDRLPVPAAVGAARGRLSDDPRADALSRRRPGGHDLVDHRAARAPVRPDARPQPDDLDQLGGRLGRSPCSSTSSSSIDIAEQQVQAAINAAGNLLPADLPAPPIYAKVNPADAPILTLAVTSKTEPLTKVHDMVDTRLAQKISQLPASAWSASRAARSPASASAPTRRARRLRPQHRRPAHHDHQRQRQHAQGQFRRPDARLHDQRQRPDHRSRDVQATSSSPIATARRCACARSATIEASAGEQPARPPG